MTEIADPTVKNWWQSMTNWSQIGLALTLFAPQKYKDLVGPTVETVGQIVLLVAAVVGRWRAGGVMLPVIGAKVK